jgi:hypothetical protein
MDTLTFLMLMMLVVLVVIVIQLRRGAGGGTCNCPIDDNWVGDFGRWVEREDDWDHQVQEWIEWAHKIMQKHHPDDVTGDPPSPPPCKFGSC